MNYSQIMSTLSPFASESGGSCPPAPMGAPPMSVTPVHPVHVQMTNPVEFIYGMGVTWTILTWC